ncbi:hypothetical protein PNP85_10420 [Halobacterium salinarum]|jgi:hypothetical protein|uniref:hypothetical protein n=1 Tax=Halobacterium salinarum TaxID=2242 RepID=UPI00255506BE|nr:hypothetical protein [Halobacterium salinarum]MDL0135819.1 hypothetical protein [Halobacterium salinarum]MDL0139918.1 hypothetical protein [Halobacterium salinarum]
MPRDIAPLTRALDDATPGDKSDVYGLLAAWNQSIETALDRGGGSRFQEVVHQSLEEVIDLVDAAATTDGVDWGFLHECVEAYPPGVGDHHCSSVLANVVARCVIRTRIREDADAIPAWTLEYLAGVTMDDDGEWAWESTAAFGWAAGHSEVAVLDRALDRAENDDESWVMGVLKHVTFADPGAGVDLLEQLLQSPDVVEDLLFVRSLESPFEQNFPNFPQYWEPRTELDYEVELSDDVYERLLAVVGQSIAPDRLRHFDDSYRIDLQRAADEYGPTADG